MKRRTFISLMSVMAAAGVLSLAGCSSNTSASTASSAAASASAAAADKLETDLSAIPADAAEAMRYSHDVLIPDMDTARRAADQLETLTSSDRWPFPTYSDLLFSV